MNRLSLKLSILVLLLGGGLSTAYAEPQKIRAAHFPNVAHAPALVARATQHFESRLGEGVMVEWKTFNAGPEAIEALFASAIDILYVGPNPAVNGYVRSKGEALRIIAGVASGGSGFVIRSDSGINRFEDLRGKRVSSPQKGNSQDVALHYLMHQKGLVPKTQGGDVEVFHISGGDQITAFLKGQVDAAWTVEPWLTRLSVEANGRILFEEGELWPEGSYATTVLIARKKFIEEHPELVHKWVEAHREIIDWMNDHYTQSKQIFNEEFARQTGKVLPPNYLDHFFARIRFTTDPMKSQVLELARHAQEIGYLGRNQPELDPLYDLSFLEKKSE